VRNAVNRALRESAA